MSLIRSLSGRLAASALLALTATSLNLAQTQAPITVFSDDFSGGSTVNTNPASPTAPSFNSTAYQVISGRPYPIGTPEVVAPAAGQPGKLRVALDTTVSTTGQINLLAEAIFSQYPVKLATAGDYIELTYTFTAETAMLVDPSNVNGANADQLMFGLYSTSSNTGGNNAKVIDDAGLATYTYNPNYPPAGGLTNGSSSVNALYPSYWRGYTARVARGITGFQGRHQVWYQNSGATPFSTSGNLTNAVGSATNSLLANLTAGQQYTAVLRITRSDSGTGTRISLNNKFYVGAGTEGTQLVNWSVSNLSGSNHTSLVYDGLALGLRINANGTNGTTQIMAINSVKVVTTGKTVVVPVILNQPTSPNPVAWGDPHTYSVVASGGGDTGGELSYQWKKNGMNIDGATSASYTIPELDYSHAGTYSVVVTNSIGSTTSADAVLFVNPPAPPTIANLIDNGIDGNPVSLTVASGSSASFTVTGVGAGLSYKWQKSTDDGTTFTDIPGATSRTYTIARTQGSSVGLYRGVVMNSSGSATSTAASLALIYNFTGITPSGYAASATGGDTATSVEVSNLADFKAQAESATAAVITVNGAINLGGKVSVKSNKTIQGKDGEATLIGNLELASGVSNVVIRGINITNPAGSGLTITGASNVYINHVSFYDCSDTLLAITGGADNVTVSWSEFYYTAANDANKAVLVGATGETKPMRVTFDHNWWSDNVETHMPDTTYGRVHMYNNLFQNEAGTAMGNTTGTLVRANAQLFSEHNQYTGVNSPLTKEGTNIGLVRVIGDVYTASSGTAAHAGGDFITFAPTYSYQLITTGSVTSTIAASAGNLAGASTTTPTPSGTASVTSTATTVPLGGSFTLTAVPNGLTVAPDAPVPPYQWRLNGTPIGGSSTSPTLTVTQATGSNTGNYTVAILLANGETVVSTPLTITATSGSSSVPSSNSEAAGGGGAPSAWFFGALALLATLRRFLIPRKAA